MKTFATVLRRTALVLTWLLSVGGLLFALGYAYEDPGGWVSVALTAAIAVPLAALTVVAMRSPEVGFSALAIGAALFAAWCVVSLFVDLVEAPVIPVAALVLAAPVAVLGQRYAMRAGWLMLALAAVPFGLVLVRMVQESGVEGPSLGDLLTTSTGIVVVPLAVLAVLFLVAGWLGHPQATPDKPQVPQGPEVVAQR